MFTLLQSVGLQLGTKILDIAEKAKLVPASLPMAAVVKQFLSAGDCQWLTVVKDRRPYGLLNRAATMELAASSSETVINLLTAGEMCPAKSLRIDGERELLDIVREHQANDFVQLRDGAMVTNGRKFAGILTLAALLKAMVSADEPAEEAPVELIEPEPEPTPFEVAEAAAPPQTPESSFQNTQYVLATLAHEVRTPLTGMMGLAEMLANRLQDTDHRDVAETIVRSGGALDRMLRDTLDYVSLESGQLSVRAETANLADLVSDVRQLWSAEASRRGLALHVGLTPGGPGRIETDLGRVGQIVNNLVSNALKFTRSGSVSVTLGTQKKAGHLALHVEVADTGRGIPASEKKRLFEAFEKRHVPEDGPGWGLGLAISHALSRHLGGDLSLRDNAGGGSVFSLAIPVRASDVIPIKPKKRRKSGRFALGEVLVIEDHEACAMVVCEALQNAGWTVRLAGSLAEAEDLLSITTYQAILTDLHLIDGSAMALIDRLRREGGTHADTPITTMTADISEGVKKACLAIGADRVLRKPIQGPELVATVADALMSRAAREANIPQLRGRIAV